MYRKETASPNLGKVLDHAVVLTNRSAPPHGGGGGKRGGRGRGGRGGGTRRGRGRAEGISADDSTLLRFASADSLTG